MDALLGAAGLGDIGGMFPDTDPQTQGISSMALLDQVARRLEAEGFRPLNCDLTILAQRPKLAPLYRSHAEKSGPGTGPGQDKSERKGHHHRSMGYEGGAKAYRPTRWP